MIVYSRWDPAHGTYDYFEADQSPGLNDDLPVPNLPAATELGVPSTECGRPLPPGAEYVGTGEWAVGLMAIPAGVEQLGQSYEALDSRSLLMMLGAGVLGVGVGIVVARRW